MKQILNLLARILSFSEAAPQMRAQRIPIRVERNDNRPTGFYR